MEAYVSEPALGYTVHAQILKYLDLTTILTKLAPLSRGYNDFVKSENFQMRQTIESKFDEVKTSQKEEIDSLGKSVNKKIEDLEKQMSKSIKLILDKIDSQDRDQDRENFSMNMI